LIYGVLSHGPNLSLSLSLPNPFFQGKCFRHDRGGEKHADLLHEAFSKKLGFSLLIRFFLFSLSKKKNGEISGRYNKVIKFLIGGDRRAI